jgi:hypothetical protein
LILLVFFLPLAIYLIVVGLVNRRPRPLLVSGTWDAVGLLFAASGFLVLGGPALLSGLYERWRTFWLLGHGGGNALRLTEAWSLWLLLSAVYFAAVVGGSAWLLWRARRLTSVYNVAPGVVEELLAEVCLSFGLDPVRSGNLFVFGMTLPVPARGVGRAPEGIQAPHYLPVSRAEADPLEEGVTARPSGAELGLADDLLGQTVVLEVETFALMRHVSLRWDPARSALRREVEAELARRLGRTPAPPNEAGAWMLMLGLFLLLAVLLGAAALVLRWVLRL